VVNYALATLRNRGLIFELARNDFRARYTGSLLGAVWAFAQPVLTIVLYLFIYKVGFKAGAPSGVPFVLWLIVGMVPWFFLTDALVAVTNSLVEYSFLVKKIVFEVSILPTIKIVSASLIHIVVWALVLVILAFCGFTPTLAWLQVPYYFFAAFALVSGVGLIAAVLTPFFRDLAQMVVVSLQFFFWLTPILWSIEQAPPRLAKLLQWNPVYYVVEGLRDALLLGKPLWAHPYLTLYFWSFVLLTNLIGFSLFRRLRPHFADVL
jgi:ABC-type polysaccharide/polyol phosphate export permease